MSRSFKPLSLLSDCCAPALMIASSLASVGMDAANGQDRVQRSTADVRERPVDELDRPRNKERWTHRGYEVRTNQFVVVANTRVEDARWAAAQMELAWADFGRLADAWMNEHRRPDFGIGAVQVFIDGNAPKDRDAPATTVNVVGIQTQIALRVVPGEANLESQLYRLKKAAGQAFLHTAELDRQLPPWACDGLAAYIAAKQLSKEDLLAAHDEENSPGAPRLGGQQWRFNRAQQDRLKMPEFDHDAAAEEVKFLLTADDAAHAPEFLAAIRQTLAAVKLRRNKENLVTARRGEEQPADLGPVDQLAIQLAPSMEQWRKTPLRGQPIVQAEENTPADVQEVEREMVVVLKLARRFATSERGTVRTRITAFEKEKGMTVLSPKSIDRPTSLPELYRTMVTPERPLWGTLDAEGQLILSSDRAALQEMLGLDDNRYRWESNDGKSVLTTTIDDQWKVQGWLEDNPDDSSRPLARFTATKLAARR